MFVHLHNHTEYSLLDGACRLDDLIAEAQRQGMPSLAITDHGVMYGTLDFYLKAKEAGIKPILGCEVYVARRGRFDREPGRDDNHFHLVLLAENEVGYHNLMRIVSLAYTEGLYYKPRCDRELLERYHEGLIALSGCIAGEVPQLILSGQYDQARATAQWYRELFGPDHYFLEIQDHGLEDQQIANQGLRRLATELDLGLVATNDMHYVRREDADVHDILLCIQTGKSVQDEKRMRFPGDAFYFRTEAEMAALFSEYPGAIENTGRIADRCRVELDLDQILLPRFEIPEDFADPEQYLKHLCQKGLSWRYGEVTAALTDRLNMELGVITEMGYASYFLIVWDFIRFAREAGISVGPGRGSAASSIVSYVLGITNIDPIAYNLVFERFLNPERISMPDIDIDFCYERRDEVIDYVVEKYGQDSVAQIITFGTMAARAVIRDVGRSLDMLYADVDRIAKMIPAQLGITLNQALELSPELRRAYQSDDAVHRLIDAGRFLEGMPRHASVHAAGVVIAEKPLMEHVPLQRMSDGSVVTQFSMGNLETLGLLKMDFLGLRTLTVIDETVRIIQKTADPAFLLANIPMDDEATLSMVARAETEGVFQLESDGMRDLLRELKPTTFEDIVASVALFRPGPMENIPTFVHNKHNPHDVDYLHPELEPILKDTYGIMVYQEQVMQVASVMAGFSLGQADILRRAMGKKKADVLESVKVEFVEGCLNHGHDIQLAEKLFSFIEKFANYGFNRGHTAPYALLAYQTAYLKANYPVAFMAALLTSIMSDSDKVRKYIDEARRLGISVSPPNINKSFLNFTADGDHILFGLAAVKNLGRSVIEFIIQERAEAGEFKSFREFCDRVDLRKLNRRAVECLIQAGAFDCVDPDRGRLLAHAEVIMASALKVQRQRESGQVSLFDGLSAESGEGDLPELALPEITPLSPQERLSMEKDVLGVYLSGHPLEQYRDLLAEETTASIGSLPDKAEGFEVVVGGLVVSQSRILTKKGDTMAFVTLEDLENRVEVVVFPEVFAAHTELLQREDILVVRGKVSHRDEDTTLLAHSFTVPGSNGQVHIQITRDTHDPERFEQLKHVLCANRGAAFVYLHDESCNATIRAGRRFCVDPTPKLQVAIERIMGPGTFHYVTCPTPRDDGFSLKSSSPEF